MGVLDTTYTFTATDVVTSAKLNNVIDQTTFTSSAFSNTTLAINSSGQLRVNTSGITQLELADNSVITAKISDNNVTTAKILDANVTQAKIAANVAGKGPAFRAWNSTLVTIPSNTLTKILFQTEDFDTNSNFADSRFTATIAGYYSINGCIGLPVSSNNCTLVIYKNNIAHSAGTSIAALTTRSSVHDIIHLNIGDFLEIYVDHQAGANRNTSNQSFDTYFSGCLIRSA
jgi:hypothetical protein